MKAIKFLSVFVLLLIISTTGNAQMGRPGLQHKRIAEGRRSGELTHREARQLSRQQRDIGWNRRAARSEGFISRSERKELSKDRKHASRNIFRKKHNHRHRVI